MTNTPPRSPDDEDHGLVQVRRSRPDRIPVLNPGDWFGKAWLVEIGGCYTPLFLVVEADNISDAIDELSDDPTFGHQIHVPESRTWAITRRTTATTTARAG